MKNCILSVLMLAVAMLFVSCSGYVPPMQKDYPDAVTCLSQVDPHYRACFRAQNGSNYTLADQRRAYLAAMQTARTPVRASDYRQVSETRLASRSSRKATRARYAASRRAVAKRGAKASRSRATASRRSARRGSRRRG